VSGASLVLVETPLTFLNFDLRDTKLCAIDYRYLVSVTVWVIGANGVMGVVMAITSISSGRNERGRRYGKEEEDEEGEAEGEINSSIGRNDCE
jgi:hypothetical protein